MKFSSLMVILAILVSPIRNLKVHSQNINRPEARNTATPMIWLCGEDPVVQRDKHKNQPADYMDLFGSTEAWPVAASRVKVFKISTQMALRGSDEQLKSIIDGLKREGIGMAIEMGVLVGSSRCGLGVEGYALEMGVENAAKRIRNLGGTLDYVAMDEPVWFGHVASGGTKCRDAIADLAEQAAPKLVLLRRYFPNVQIGEIEPVNGSQYALSLDSRFIDDVMEFEGLAEKKSGVKLAFLHADVAWTTNWRPELEMMANRAHARGMRFGLICDGDANAGGDEAWVQQAIQRCRDVAANPRTRPDDLIVQSWEPLPTRMLPETNPGSLTFEAKQLSMLFPDPPVPVTGLMQGQSPNGAGQPPRRLVWLAGIDPVVAADRQRIGMTAQNTNAINDFMDLFQPDAPWRKSASLIQVFKVSTQFLHRSTDEQLSTVIKDLQRRHIALGLAAEIMATTAQCGNGVPGYTTKAVIQAAADRVARLGGKIDYVAFDSPMAFGHFNILNKNNACHYTTEELVRNITPQIQILKAAFPGIIFGDVEPVNNHTVGWINDYLEFARQFLQQTGEHLTFMQADIIWYDNWQPQLVEWRKRLHDAGISYGVIFDGSAIDKSDLEWTNHAIERYRMVTANPGTRPDDMVFQTWHSYPTHFLPESQQGTLTSVVLQTLGTL